MRTAVVFGTRPEAIKMAPVVHELRTHPRARKALDTSVIVTAQHRDLLDGVLGFFEITPDADLDAMRPGQDLATLTARLIEGLDRIFRDIRPDLVLVHGDTTTAIAGALAAYYLKIPVGHVEAGLRTHNRYSPFPEEMNRHLVDALATHHFAPTTWAAENLRREGLDPGGIVVTGNTGIDALRLTLERMKSGGTDVRVRAPALAEVLYRHDQIVLVTSHRRENFGERLIGICQALVDLTRHFPDIAVVYPVHPNPNVRGTVARYLQGHDRIHLIEPLEYDVFCHLMAASRLILTDSGGIQEEAPSLDKPVLVLRDTSERPEAVEAGAVRVVGTDREAIVEATKLLLTDEREYQRMARAANPYGDGFASRRIVERILRDHPTLSPKVACSELELQPAGKGTR